MRDGTGRPLTAYDREHVKELHLIVASRDLATFRHLHRARAADGTWPTSVDLPEAGRTGSSPTSRPRAGKGSHSAPMPGDGKAKPGPEISFTATAPSPGAYRLFLDFKHQGKVHTAAFTGQIARNTSIG